MQTVKLHHNNINSEMLQTAGSLRTELQRGTRQIQDSISEKTNERWRVKKMHGQMPSNLDEKLAVNGQSYRWPKFRDIQGETESAIVAAERQAIVINYFINNILKEELTVNTGYVKSGKKKLLCCVDHRSSGCRILVANGPLMRHGDVCAHLHY